MAALLPGERVVDVACGTGVVSRLAAERVATAGSVVGVDVNPAIGALLVTLLSGIRLTSSLWFFTTVDLPATP